MKANSLKEGRVYFSCAWSNPKYPVPVIRTYVYIGKNIEPDRVDKSQNEYVFAAPDSGFRNSDNIVRLER